MTNSVSYLDYNATTIMPDRVLNALIKWSTNGNASSIYPSAKSAKNMINKFKEEIAKICGFSLNDYAVIFTSGGSESNTWVITAAVRSYMRMTGKRAHLITSNIEHDNIRMLCDNLEQEDIDITYVPVRKTGPELGSVHPEDIYNAIRPNTCLITIMAANNESGVRNNIKAIGYVAKQKGVPFFTDAVQIFGKEPLYPEHNNITAFSGSFHKLHGPTGTGLVVIKKSFIKGYDIKPLIPGHQNNEMRGGTECVHNIAAAREAYLMTFENRDDKTKNIEILKNYTLKQLSQMCKVVDLEDYQQNKYTPPLIVNITPTSGMVLPSTLFISIYLKNVCNSKVRQELADRSVFISIGSACKTGDKKSSHVLDAMGVPGELVPGVIRISIGDYTTKNNINMFVKELYNIIVDKKCYKTTP